MIENIKSEDVETLRVLRDVIAEKNEIFESNGWFARFDLWSNHPYYRLTLNTQPDSRNNRRVVDIMSLNLTYLVGVVSGSYEAFQGMKAYYKR